MITGSREPLPLERVTADVVVIDANRIRDASADSLEDLLRREAGLQLSRNGGPGQSAAVFIRGASASSAVVLIDGVRIGSATLGQASLEGLGLAQIERIEVLRGPASSLYGADALGGVVQIFTRRGEGAPRLAAHAAAGGYGSSEASVALSGAQGSLEYAATLADERSDGVSAVLPGDQFGNHNPDADGYQRRTAQLRLGYTPAAGHRLGLVASGNRLDSQYDAAEFNPPDFLPDPSPDFRNKLDTAVVSLDYRGNLTPAWTTSAQVARSVDKLKSGASTSSRFDTRREQFSWQNAWQFTPGHQLVGAFDYLEERAEADSYAADVKRDNKALVVAYAGSFGAQALQADLRYDDNSAYGSQRTGRIGWSLELAPGWRVRALAGTTFRAPSFNDLYFPGYGVPGVQPERGRSVELGIAWQGQGADAQATVYQNRVRDLIGYESDRSFCPPDPSYDFGCARNIARARLQGATLAFGKRFGALEVRALLDFLDATDTDTGSRLARRAAHQESLSADYAAGGWTFGASVLGVGARPDGGSTLGAEQTLDLRATWRFAPQWRVEAKLLNATDETVRPARDYQGLGRQAWLGLRFDARGF